jgi:hypothetical protein
MFLRVPLLKWEFHVEWEDPLIFHLRGPLKFQHLPSQLRDMPAHTTHHLRGYVPFRSRNSVSQKHLPAEPMCTSPHATLYAKSYNHY